MRVDEQSECSHCYLPARTTALLALLTIEPHCPMCMGAVRGGPVDAAEVAKAALLKGA